MKGNDEVLQRIRELYAKAGISALHGDIVRTVKLVVYGGNYPSSYSPTDNWDEDAFVMLANDFIVGVLEKNGYLAHLLRTSRDGDSLSLALESSFRNFLVNQKRRTIEDNLYRRINELLSGDPVFEILGNAPRDHKQLWKLADTEVTTFIIDDDELISVCADIEPVPVKDYKPDSRKLPHLIGREPLHNLIVSVFQASRAALTVPQILSVVRHKLGLHSLRTVALDEPVPGMEGVTWKDFVKDTEQSYAAVEAKETANGLLAQLTQRQSRIVALYAEGRSLDEIAHLVGCSKATVHNDLYSALKRMKEVGVETPGEAKQVLEAIAELVTSAK